MTFGMRVQMLRERESMTRQELADRLDMKPQTLRHYEIGDREPGTETIIAIAKVFNVTVDWLIGNETEPIRPAQWALIRATRELSDDQIRSISRMISDLTSA